MVAYSFQKRFAPPILAGDKRQTIRGERLRHARPGEVLQLYTGLRTKYCRLIGTATCQLESAISIQFAASRIVYAFGAGVTTVFPGGLDAFARSDGFADWDDMRAFWTKNHHGLSVFTGRLIRWTEFQPSVVACPMPAKQEPDATTQADGERSHEDHAYPNSGPAVAAGRLRP